MENEDVYQLAKQHISRSVQILRKYLATYNKTAHKNILFQVHLQVS